jgi:heat shock protein HtpX
MFVKVEEDFMFAIGKRLFLFLAVNLLVVLTLSLVLNLLGVRPYLTPYGLDYGQLLAFCLIWGMGGAFISLALSRVMAKWMMGVKLVDPNSQDPSLQELVQSVYQLSRGAGLSVMPQVGIYDSPEVNAFATGPSRSRALVAVSSGLLRQMKSDEIYGVLGHEIAHVANGDMVTMTLVQGVVNAFVMFLSRVIAFAISQLGRSRDSERGSSFSPITFYIVTFILEIIFMILGSIVVAYFSRYREYRADAGGAKLAGRENMIKALQALSRNFDRIDTQAQPAVQSLKISSRSHGFMRFFSTHPPLQERIARLENMISA